MYFHYQLKQKLYNVEVIGYTLGMDSIMLNYVFNKYRTTSYGIQKIKQEKTEQVEFEPGDTVISEVIERWAANLDNDIQNKYDELARNWKPNNYGKKKR